MALIPSKKEYPKAPSPTSPPGLGRKVEETLLRALANVRDVFTEWIEDRLVNFALRILGAFEDELSPLARPLIETLESVGPMPAAIQPLLDELKSPSGQALGAVLGGLSSQVTSTGLGGALNALFADVGYGANRQFNPARLDVSSALVTMMRGLGGSETALGDLRDQGWTADRINYMSQLLRQYPDFASMLELLRRGEMTEDTVRSYLAQQGFSVTDANDLLKLQQITLGGGEVRDLFLRGDINESDHDTRLRALGVSDSDLPLLKQLYQFIPPANDLITMAVREAFSPEAVQRLSLDAEFPPDFARYARKQGISEEWAKMYWRAHWVLPSAQMGFEMFQRSIIDSSELNDLLKALDFAPVWRDKLTSMSYRTLTRVDVRRMYQLGVLDRDAVLTSYLDLGYSPENAEQMTVFTVLYASETERDLTKSDIVGGYKDGAVDRGLALEFLMLMGYDPNESEFYLVRADLDLDADHKKKVIEDTHVLFVRNLISANDAYAALGRLQLAGLEIDRLMTDWRREIQTRSRQLTKADINKLYEYGIVDRATTLSLLNSINYRPEVAAQLLAVWDTDLAKAEEKKKIIKYRLPTNTELKKLYLQEIMPGTRVREILAERMYNAETIEYFMEMWEEEKDALIEKELQQIEDREHPEPRLLSRAQVGDFYMAGIITEVEARQALAHLNFTEENSDRTLVLWDMTIAEDVAVEEERLARELLVKPRLLTRAQVGQLYQTHTITDVEARELMKYLEYSGTDIERTMTLWDDQVAEAKLKEEERIRVELELDPRLLTRSQVGELFNSDVVDESDARALLEYLEYRPIDIERTMTLWLEKKEGAE